MRWFHDVLRDLRYGLRMVQAAPLVSIAVVVTLAVGIGLDTGAFTVINGMLLRPRCEATPETYARLYAQYTERGSPRDYAGLFSIGAYRALQQQSKVLLQLAAWRSDGVLMEDDATRSLALEVSCNFFSVYGLEQPRAGRFFRPDECSPASSAQVAIISEELWRDRFASDPQILGRILLLNRQPFTVVGIAPRDFSGRLRGPGIWVPYDLQSQLTGKRDVFQSDDTPSFWLEGRIRPGYTRKDLASEVGVIASRLKGPNDDWKTAILVTDGSIIHDPNVRSSAVWIIALIISGLTLLLAVSCATTAVLLLSRATARRREIAVRISLGARRTRILRQLLAETVLLAIAAGVTGIYLAVQVPRAFQAMVPAMPHFPFTLDWHIFSYLAGITLTAAVLAGLAPALECLRQDVWASLKGQEATVRAGRVRWSIRDLLVIVQVGFSMVLMVISAMFIRVELAIINSDPGFDTTHVLQVPIQLPLARYDTAQADAFYAALQQRLAALPGVEQVAAASSSPLGPEAGEMSEPPQFRLLSQSEREAKSATLRHVSADYFSSLSIQTLRGEVFRNIPSELNGAVVSQAFAAAFWPGRDPIGEVVVGPDGARLRVVAVVTNTRTEHFGQPDGPCVYLLRRTPINGDMLLLRFQGPAQPLESTVKDVVHSLDPQIFVLSTTLRGALDDFAERFWTLGKMLLFVALVAAGLALFGIYGVVGYSVTRRTREFGIRAALGASRTQIMGLVLRNGARPLLAGVAFGLVCAVGFAYWIVALLRNAPDAPPANDPIVYGAVCALMVWAAMLAMLGHARRAAHIEPLVALREE